MADTSWERDLERLDNLVQCTTAEVYAVVEGSLRTRLCVECFTHIITFLLLITAL